MKDKTHWSFCNTPLQLHNWNNNDKQKMTLHFKHPEWDRELHLTRARQRLVYLSEPSAFVPLDMTAFVRTQYRKQFSTILYGLQRYQRLNSQKRNFITTDIRAILARMCIHNSIFWLFCCLRIDKPHLLHRFLQIVLNHRWLGNFKRLAAIN